MNHDKFGIGLSGCKLELINDRVIRKYSSSEQYNSRLQQQINKQNLFSNLIFRNIDTPKILNINGESALHYFDMEYVSGYSFQEYFKSADVKQIDFVADTLICYLDDFLNNYNSYSINTQLIAKIDSLQQKSNFGEFLEYIKLNLVDEIKVPKTFCHGDLTFANIIFHKNRLFFIDFLDSYVDSVYSDLVKLKQEVFYNWNLNILGIQSLRIHQAYRYIWNRIENRYAHVLNSKEFHILDAINLLRIEPYLIDNRHNFILENIVRRLSLYEQFNSSNGRKIV